MDLYSVCFGLMLDLLAPPCANVHSLKLGVNHYGLARKLGGHLCV